MALVTAGGTAHRFNARLGRGSGRVKEGVHWGCNQGEESGESRYGDLARDGGLLTNALIPFALALFGHPCGSSSPNVNLPDGRVPHLALVAQRKVQSSRHLRQMERERTTVDRASSLLQARRSGATKKGWGDDAERCRAMPSTGKGYCCPHPRRPRRPSTGSVSNVRPHFIPLENAPAKCLPPLTTRYEWGSVTQGHMRAH